MQHELIPRVSVEGGYNRRWWGNHFVTVNTLVDADDYDTWTVPIPTHENLPGGGSSASFVAIKPEASALGARTLQTKETNYAPARTSVLARRRFPGDRTVEQRRDAAGRHQHRPRRAQHVRVVGSPARPAERHSSAERHPGPPANRFVRRHRTLDHHVQSAGVIPDSQGRRPRQHDLPIDKDDGKRRRGEQRHVAGGELPNARTTKSRSCSAGCLRARCRRRTRR